MAEIVQRKAGVIQSALRAGMRLTTMFYPRSSTVRQTRIDGLTLLVWANEYIGRRILTTGSFEKEDLARLSKLVSQGDTCIDVGANIGLYSLYLARLVGPAGRVLAFEPVTRNALLTALNCELNGFTQVTVERAPLSDRSGSTMLASVPENDSAYSYFKEQDAGEGTVTSVTMDDFCERRGIKQVGFIKIDVEGAEFNVLRGGDRLLRSPGKPRVIMVEMVEEYLGRFGHSIADVCSWMAERGYRPSRAVGNELRVITVDEIEAENVFFVAPVQTSAV